MDVTQGLSSLESQDGVRPLRMTLVHSKTSETEVLDLESGEYKKSESITTVSGPE